VDLSRRPVDLAVALARAGAEVVVVGGTARLLRGAARAPRDLDVAVAPSAVDGLVGALGSLGVRTTAARLLRCRCSRVRTTYGPLDVFVGPAPAAGPLAVAGSVLQVAR
jgi:NAD(P)-dependent dehydrogenase (short-subunit alcohol dehydrogenase family)